MSVFITRSVSYYVMIACSFNDLLCCLRSEAKDILGDDWIQRHRRIVQQNANQYKRVAWAKVSGSAKSSKILRDIFAFLFGCMMLDVQSLLALFREWIFFFGLDQSAV